MNNKENIDNTKNDTEQNNNSNEFKTTDVFKKYQQARQNYSSVTEKIQNIQENHEFAQETIKKNKTSFKENIQQVRQLAKELGIDVNLENLPNKQLKETLIEKVDWVKNPNQEFVKNTTISTARELAKNSDLNFAEIIGNNIDEYGAHFLNIANTSEDDLKEMLHERLDSIAMYEEQLNDEAENIIDNHNNKIENQQDKQENLAFHQEINDVTNEISAAFKEVPDSIPKEKLTAPLQEIKTITAENKEIVINLSKGLKHGPMTIKNHSGHAEMEMEFAKDKLHGISKYYFADGTLERQIEFQEGKMHGLMQVFSSEGKPSMEIYYENGVMHGSSTMYNEQGEVHITSNYKYGKLEGDMIIFSNGKPYLKKTYKNGIAIDQEFDSKAMPHVH